MEIHDRDPFALMHQDCFTVEQLARVAMLAPSQIEREVFEGHLRASIIDHHIVHIDRDDAIDWLRRRKPDAFRPTRRPDAAQ